MKAKESMMKFLEAEQQRIQQFTEQWVRNCTDEITEDVGSEEAKIVQKAEDNSKKEEVNKEQKPPLYAEEEKVMVIDAGPFPIRGPLTRPYAQLENEFMIGVGFK